MNSLNINEPRAVADSSRSRRFLQCRLELRWKKYRKALKRARQKLSEDSLHELRLETRRMLGLLQLFHPFCPAKYITTAERKFKKCFKTSGDLRDTQVQQLYLEHDLKRYPELAPFFKWLCKREKRLARRFKKTIRHGCKPKLKATMKTLRKWSRASLHAKGTESFNSAVLLDKVKTMYLDVLRLRNHVRANRPSTIHRLRIAFKPYRYVVETLCPDILQVGPQLTQLQNYQAIMGDIQDLEVLLATLGAFEKAKGKTNLAIYRTELKRRHAGLIKRFWITPLPPALL